MEFWKSLLPLVHRSVKKSENPLILCTVEVVYILYYEHWYINEWIIQIILWNDYFVISQQTYADIVFAISVDIRPYDIS